MQGEPGTAAGIVRIPVPAPGLQRAGRKGAVAEHRNLTGLQFALMNIKHSPAVSGLIDPRSLPICKAEEIPQMPRKGEQHKSHRKSQVSVFFFFHLLSEMI